MSQLLLFLFIEGFAKEKGAGGGLDLQFYSQPSTNSQPKGVRGLERLGWFPKFYPVLSSVVSLKGCLGVVDIMTTSSGLAFMFIRICVSYI